MADPVLQSPAKPHFFQPLFTGFHSHLNIPVKFFSTYIEGKNQGNTVHLRSDSSEKTWKVTMEGRRLTVGWKEFAAAHDFRTNDIIVFRHEGDLVFHVTGFGTSFCEHQYVKNNTSKFTRCHSGNLSTEQNLITEPDISSDKSCFVAHITESNLGEDRRLLPRKFIRSDGLKEGGSDKIILTNEVARTWELNLNFKESTISFTMSVGWRSFCHENGLKAGDSITFKLECSNGRTPLLRFSTAESKGVSKTRVSSSSSSSTRNVSRFVKLKFTPASLKYCRLHLPQSFTKGNKMEKARGKKITLLDQDRVEWPVKLLSQKGNRRMHLSTGIKGFFKAIGIKPYQSFLLELVWEDRTTLPMLKFCSKLRLDSNLHPSCSQL